MAKRTKLPTYQLAVIANDFHIPFHDERALSLFNLFLRRERPDWLILNGDFQDFWEISSPVTAGFTGSRSPVYLEKQRLQSPWKGAPE